MEELKLLIEMVSDLPAMAIWVLVGFFVYKVVIVGSVYGVIKLGITKIHDVLQGMSDRAVKIAEQEASIEKEKLAIDSYAKLGKRLDKMCIEGIEYDLLDAVSKIKGSDGFYNRGVSGNSAYIHRSDVRWLLQAIEEKKSADVTRWEEKKKARAI